MGLLETLNIYSSISSTLRSSTVVLCRRSFGGMSPPFCDAFQMLVSVDESIENVMVLEEDFRLKCSPDSSTVFKVGTGCGSTSIEAILLIFPCGGAVRRRSVAESINFSTLFSRSRSAKLFEPFSILFSRSAKLF